MSSVRMCDKCATIFSELEEGWQSFTATTTRRDPDTGKRVEVTIGMDACPACALQPRHQFDAERSALIAGKEREARIARLERENGIVE